MARSVLVLLLLTTAAQAHEIPNDVTIQMYVRPDGDRMILLVRAPLEALRDIEWPLRDPGFLELDRMDVLLDDAATIWLAQNITVFEGGKPLGVPSITRTRVSLPSDPAFISFEDALAHMQDEPLDSRTNIYWQQALVDVQLEYPITSDRAVFSIRPGLERLGLRVLTVIRFLPVDGTERIFEFDGDPGRVALDPRWYQAALTFVRLGFDHILGGFDHLLFLLCLVIPIRRLRPLVTVVTAFTLAHSITLIAAAYGLTPNSLWFPPFIETMIAASIVTMAIGNIIRPGVHHRWMIAFGFGLVHGFGFSFALSETMQLAGEHLPTALFSFNIGVELGQLLVLLALIPGIWLFLRLGTSDRVGTIVLSALVGHTAWHWMLDRGSQLSQYSWSPNLVVTPGVLLRWLMLAVIIVAAAWLFSIVAGSPRRESSPALE